MHYAFLMTRFLGNSSWKIIVVHIANQGLEVVEKKVKIWCQLQVDNWQSNASLRQRLLRSRIPNFVNTVKNTGK